MTMTKVAVLLWLFVVRLDLRLNGVWHWRRGRRRGRRGGRRRRGRRGGRRRRGRRRRGRRRRGRRRFDQTVT